MTGELYIVYKQTDVWVDPDWSETVYEVTDRYFTNEDQAELCADYLDMSTNGCHFVKEITNGDDVDFESLIEELEIKQREKEVRREKNNRLNNVDSYALFKSRVEGCSYSDLLKEFKVKYADYVDNGAHWADDNWNNNN